MKKIQIKKPKYDHRSDDKINEKTNIIATVKKMISAITNPEKAVESAPNFKNTIKHSILILTVFITLLMSITTIENIDIVTLLLLGPIMAIIFLTEIVILSSIIWAFGMIMNGKQNFEAQTNAFMLIIIPIFIIISIVQAIQILVNLKEIGIILSFVLALYALFSISIITRKITEMPTWKVVVSIIMTLVISILVVLSFQIVEIEV